MDANGYIKLNNHLIDLDMFSKTLIYSILAI